MALLWALQGQDDTTPKAADHYEVHDDVILQLEALSSQQSRVSQQKLPVGYSNRNEAFGRAGRVRLLHAK